MCGYAVTKEELERMCAPTPFIRKRLVTFHVEIPGVVSSKPETELERMSRESAERERKAALKAKANTVAMPIDSGEYLYYHKSDGKFHQLDWHTKIHHDIVLDKEEMSKARAAFKERWPGEQWFEDYYDPETGKWPR